MQPRSVRLNQDLRDEFITTVIIEIMPDEKEPTVERFQKNYAQKAYNATYGNITDITDQLPTWAMRETKCFFVHLKDVEDALAFILDKPVRCFHNENYNNYNDYRMFPDSGSPIPSLENDHEITIAYKANVQALQDWDTKKRALRSQLVELTNNCNTTGQLFKTWPKAMEFAHIFPQPEVKERKVWEPTMDAAELDLGIELSQVEVAPIEEN